MKVLEVKNLSFAYEDKILEEVSFSIEEGEFVAIIGKNGAGKSTLLNIILSNLKCDGEIKLFGDDINKNNHYRDIAFISQNSVMNYKNFPTTVEEVVKNHVKYLKAKTDVATLLKEMGLFEHKNKSLSKLSGGQLQRVGLLLALIKNARLIILDEPTTGIDKKFSLELFETLRNLKDRTVLMVTHELEDTKNFVDYFLQVQDKKVFKCESGGNIALDV